MQKQELRLELEIRLLPACVADFGKVRLGGESPSFGPVRRTAGEKVADGKAWT